MGHRRVKVVSLVLLLHYCWTFICVDAQFQVPDAIIEVYSPKGFKVSIPDEPGIKLFAFHGKINEEMNGREAGTFSRDTTRAKNGHWSFVDKTTKLNIGDVINYWTYVDYNDGQRTLGYTNDDQSFTVTEIIPDPDKPMRVTPTPRTTTANPNCPQTETKVNGRRSCRGRVIFEENFQAKLFKNQKWTIENRFSRGPDYEYVVYMNDNKILKTENSQLVITPVLADEKIHEDFATDPEGYDLGTNCTSTEQTECYRKPVASFILPPVVSGQINTKKFFSFLYGTVEIRAKFPKGNWIYPQLYLNSKNSEYGQGINSGRIVIGFSPGNDRLGNVLAGGCTLGTSKFARSFAKVNTTHPSELWSDDFHTFIVKWKPDGISVRVDGTEYGTIAPPEGGFVEAETNLKLPSGIANKWRTGTDLAPFDKEMYITIGVGVGGQVFDDEPDKPWKNTDPKNTYRFWKDKPNWYQTWGDDRSLMIDYVKVTAL